MLLPRDEPAHELAPDLRPVVQFGAAINAAQEANCAGGRFFVIDVRLDVIAQEQPKLRVFALQDGLLRGRQRVEVPAAARLHRFGAVLVVRLRLHVLGIGQRDEVPRAEGIQREPAS